MSHDVGRWRLLKLLLGGLHSRRVVLKPLGFVGFNPRKPKTAGFRIKPVQKQEEFPSARLSLIARARVDRRGRRDQKTFGQV